MIVALQESALSDLKRGMADGSDSGGGKRRKVLDSDECEPLDEFHIVLFSYGQVRRSGELAWS